MNTTTTHILFANTDKAEAELISDTLCQREELRCHITIVSSVADAIGHIGRSPCNVVLLDLALPGHNGVEAIHAIRKHTHNLAIIALTRVSNNGLSFEALRAGAQEYLHKEALDSSTLVRALRYAIERVKAQTAFQAEREEREAQLKRAQEESAEYARRLSTLINNLPGVAYRCANDPHWTMEYISDGVEQLTGYPASDFIANRVRSFESVMDPDYSNIVRERIEEALRRNEPYGFQYKIRCSLGEAKWVWEKGRGVRDASGQVVALEGFIQDITEQKRVEEERKHAHDAVREAERFSHSLINVVPEGISVADLEGKITFASPQLVKMYGGVGPADAIGTHTLAWIAPKSREEAMDNIRALVQRDVPVANEYALLKKDGTPFLGEITSALLRDEQGKPTAIVSLHRDITERKRMEDALHESQRFIEGIIDTIPVRVFWKDRNLRYLGCNAIFARDAGFTDPTDIIGKDDCQMGWRDQAELYRADDRQVIESGKSKILIEEPQTTPEGNTITLLTSKVPLLNSRGEITGVLGTYIDITERKRAEEALTDSELRFQSLAEAAPVGIFRTNASGSTTYVNRRWCEISQMGFDEALGDGWLQAVHPDDLATLGATWQQASSAHAPSQVEYRFLHRDGTIAWVAGHAVPQQNARGEFDGYIGTVTDITERKRTEVKLQQLSTAVEQSPASIVITDIKGNIEYVNPKFEQVTGYTLAEIMGKNPNILKAGEKTQEEYAELWQTISAGREWRGEFHNKKKNGELYWESASISPIIDPNGITTHFLAVKEDITQQKLYEETFRQTQKMQSIGTLAGGIAHDFNNILGIIIGHSGLLRENDNTSEQFSRSLSAIDTAAQRGASLVRQILTFARKSEIRFELVRINDIIKELAKLFEETFPKSITFSFQLGRQLSLIDGDATQLHQTLLNLCVNARDAMPHGGTISIATETVSGEAVQRRFPHATMDEYVQVTVRDNGAGMNEEVRKRIFEPFYTTKELGKGTGLGLSVVYGIIDEHHGFIDVESKPGEGTTFRMYFPEPGNRLDQIAKKEEEQVRAGGKNETILVVEDEELLRDAIKNILTSNGYRVLTAIDGMEAVEIFKNERTPIALVLMDFGLPKLSGLDALRRMKGINPKVKCIVSSGYIDPEIREEILGLDIADVLPKPYLEGDILSLVRNVLDGNEKTGPKD